MGKKTTVTVPCVGGATKEITGQVAVLQVGQDKVRFLIHPRHSQGGEMVLTHLESGGIFGSLMGIKYEFARSYKKITDRAAAEELVRRVIDVHGLEKVQQVIADGIARAAELKGQG